MYTCTQYNTRVRTVHVYVLEYWIHVGIMLYLLVHLACCFVWLGTDSSTLEWHAMAWHAIAIVASSVQYGYVTSCMCLYVASTLVASLTRWTGWDFFDETYLEESKLENWYEYFFTSSTHVRPVLLIAWHQIFCCRQATARIEWIWVKSDGLGTSRKWTWQCHRSSAGWGSLWCSFSSAFVLCKPQMTLGDVFPFLAAADNRFLQQHLGT